jgi:methanethiol S-methyltransferase
MAAGWYKIVRARDSLVVDGIYRHVRQPQYTGLFLIILGMLVQWPTIPTVVMGPVLLIMYYRLAFREERDLLDRFGDKYVRYRDRPPAFLPDMGRVFASRLSY